MARNNRRLADDPVVVRIMAEVEQAPSVRRPLLAALEAMLGRRVLIYFTSFTQPVMIEDADADVIESALRPLDLRGGLTVVINSPGGDALAAERIINVCRAYSGGDFEAIVPKMAKSAATMICFGARKIWMSRTSELGPIDTQVLRNGRLIAAHTIIRTYDELLRTTARGRGPIDPYLEQLSHYDAADVNDLRTAQRLAESISVTALRTGMMKGTPAMEVRRRIRPFIDPSVTLAHGRRIGPEAARRCGLIVGELPLDGEVWGVVWELYARASWCVANRSSRLVQTRDHCVESPPLPAADEVNEANGPD